MSQIGRDKNHKNIKNIFLQDGTSVIAIDLGLPSRTKWACCNVGASHPEDVGSFYAWGEIEEKNVYDWSTYIHCNGTEETCHYIGDNIAGTKYDVSHMKWGGLWQMPTPEQINELIDYTTYKWIYYKGIFGGLFTGRNGNSIFLPAAGGKHGSKLLTCGIYGYYWTGVQNCCSNDVFILHFGSCFADWCQNNWYRNVGLSIRPVLCQ